MSKYVYVLGGYLLGIMTGSYRDGWEQYWMMFVIVGMALIYLGWWIDHLDRRET